MAFAILVLEHKFPILSNINLVISFNIPISDISFLSAISFTITVLYNPSKYVLISFTLSSINVYGNELLVI